jgi:hypothetical protein
LNKKITELEVAETITSGDLVEVVQGGVNKQSTFTRIRLFLGNYFQLLSEKNENNGYAGLSGLRVVMKNVANTFSSYLLNNNTGSRTYTFQDRTGTLADLQDIEGLDIRVTDLENEAGLGGTYATGQIFVTFLGGLELQVDWPLYYIDSIQYPFGSDTITLDTADATNDRFDAVILTASGLDKITGTPSATPEQPTIDPTSQLIVTYVLVAANQTDLTTGDIKIYDEGTETTVTSNNGTLDDQSTDISPVSDTYVLKLGSFNNTHYIDFTFGSAQSIAGVTQLSYYLWLAATFTNTTYLRWQFYLSGSPVSNLVNVTSGNYNFNRLTTAAWQLNIVPWGAFTFTSGTFDKVRISFNGSNATGFYLDFINLNIGVGSSSPLQNFFKTIIVDGDPVVATQPNDTLVFTGGVSKTAEKTIDFTGGGGGSLDDLTDVTITTPSDGDVLTYDSGTSEWVNAAPTGGALDLEQVLTEGNDGGALQIKNIADPTDPQDAATKKYVDDFITVESYPLAVSCLTMLSR